MISTWGPFVMFARSLNSPQISFGQSICFLWFYSNAIQDMTSPPWSTFFSATITSPTTRNSPLAATLLPLLSPALTIELILHVDIGTFFLHADVKSRTEWMRFIYWGSFIHLSCGLAKHQLWLHVFLTQRPYVAHYAFSQWKRDFACAFGDSFD